ncbi:MAG: S-layer family protein [Cyanobacteriota bacterium]|nr:S-layer family protein [Cyanobacteriota bacterium]
MWKSYPIFARLRIPVIASILIGTATTIPNSARTQIVRDPTSSEGSIVTREDALLRIRGGTQAGGNLFHSFLEFNILTGETAYFDNALDIDNIIARVTGDRLSEIDGTLRANGSANLFLLNPNGLIFGPNAVLEVGGSFFATSADRLVFEDGTVYSARQPEPLLTVSVPIGLQLNEGAAPIRVTGPGHDLRFDPNTLATIRDERPPGLQVAPGRTLALIGGDIEVTGGNLTAAGGHIELGSIAAGTVKITPTPDGWSFDYPQANTFGDIHLSRTASIDTSGEGGGFVEVRARNLSVADGSTILADTLGDRSGGGVRIETTDSVEVTGISEDGSFFSSIFASVAPGASGVGGNLNISTRGLRVTNEGTIAADTFGAGNAGSLTLQAETIDMNRSFVVTLAQQDSTGDGGDLTVETDRLVVAGGAQILSLTEGAGDAGNLSIRATDSVEVTGTGMSAGFRFASALAATAEAGSTGNGGDLTVETDRLRVTNGGGIGSGTDGTGDSGNLTVRATESVEVSGNGGEGIPSNIFTSLFTGVPGTEFDASGGTLTLETERLVVRDGGQISVGTFGGGRGGNLEIRASERIELSGSIAARDFSQRTFFSDESGERIPSGLFAVSEGSGEAGNLSIATSELIVRDGARATVESRDTGRAGNLSVVARDIFLDRGGGLRADSQGGLGNINLNSQGLQLRDRSQISTNSSGLDPGGNITIETQTLVALDNSDISANATNSRGGRVTIAAQAIFGIGFSSTPTPESDITATSELGTDFSGMVSIQTPDLDPARGIVALSADSFDSTESIARSCLAPSHHQQGRFVIVGSGGLPARPEGPASSPFETYQIPQELPKAEMPQTAMPIVEAQGIFQLEDDRFILGRTCSP